jgi:hypothetical protein
MSASADYALAMMSFNAIPTYPAVPPPPGMQTS